MSLSELPHRVGTFTPDGLNLAVRRLGGKYDEAATHLTEDPRATIEHVIALTSGQKKDLDAMSDGDVAELVRPVVEALRSGRPFKLDIEYPNAIPKPGPPAAKAPQQTPGGQGGQQPPQGKRKCHIKVEVDVDL